MKNLKLITALSLFTAITAPTFASHDNDEQARIRAARLARFSPQPTRAQAQNVSPPQTDTAIAIDADALANVVMGLEFSVRESEEEEKLSRLAIAEIMAEENRNTTRKPVKEDAEKEKRRETRRESYGNEDLFEGLSEEEKRDLEAILALQHDELENFIDDEDEESVRLAERLEAQNVAARLEREEAEELSLEAIRKLSGQPQSPVIAPSPQLQPQARPSLDPALVEAVEAVLVTNYSDMPLTEKTLDTFSSILQPDIKHPVGRSLSPSKLKEILEHILGNQQ